MKNESYEEFVEKFKPKKTTDDCYTPPEVYEVIKDWVCRRYGTDPEKIIRPFWPGADYRAMEYPDYIVTTAMMQKMAKYGIEYQVEKSNIWRWITAVRESSGRESSGRESQHYSI